jgi:cation diffusion facilitator family transporter
MKVTHVLLIEGAVNLIIAAAKLVVGITTGSFAILADAFHSLSDVANNGLAWIVQRISEKPADADHPYGHKKFEYLAVFVLALLLCVIAIELVTHAFTHFDDVPSQNDIGFFVMLIAAGASGFVSLFERYWAKRLNSKLLDADAKHSFADMGTTLVAIIGWQFSLQGYPWLDAVMALGIAAFVVFIAVGLFKQTIPVLVDQAVINEDELISAASAVPGVLSVNSVKSRSTGEGDIVEINAHVDPNLSTQASHHIADRLEADLIKRFNLVNVIVHIEPV